ncbi:MAG TPA: four helix bundle protein [Candidatus Acidoferrum sp.]|nr:four helix bundle protein [Candidatus Acidoferrum sp.]
MQSVRELKIWQKAMDLVEACYRLSATLPADERFGLTSQIRRAATSIPANIAEGFGRWNTREFGGFLAISCGSLRELETHVIITQRLGYVSEANARPVLRATDELAKMLFRMRERVTNKTEVSEGEKRTLRANDPR